MARDGRNPKHKKQKRAEQRGGNGGGGGNDQAAAAQAAAEQAIRKSARKLGGRNLGKARINDQIHTLAARYSMKPQAVRKIFDPAFLQAGGRL